MKYSVFTFRNVLMFITLFSFSFFVACSDDDLEVENGEDAVWEPYQVKSNTSFRYDYDERDNDEVISEGTINIIVGDPEVEITGTIDGQDLYLKENDSDDVTENFVDAIKMTPAGFLYNPFWESAFMGQDLEVGSKWSYPFGGISYEFEVTGTAEYSGYEGYLVELIYVNESGKTDSWHSCINEDIPLALMTHVILDHDNPEEYYMELTNYEEE